MSDRREVRNEKREMQEIKMVKIKNLNFEELQDFVQNPGLETYRAKQIAQWLYKKRVNPLTR